MRCNFVRFAAVAVMLSITAGQAWAFPPANPYVVPPSVLQKVANGGLTVDRTGDFSGNTQASTAVTSQIANGLQVNVNWSTGAPFTNETFTRIVLTQQYDGNFGGDGDRGDLDAYDGARWVVTSDSPFTVKPYTQVGNTFTFYEGTQADTGCGVGAFCIPGGNVPTVVQIDWNMVNNGGSIPAGNVGGRGDIFEHGFQIFGPGLAQDGTTAQASFTITNVPEPASLALVSLGGLALVGVAGRRRK